MMFLFLLTLTVKNFSYTLVDGEVYYRENSRMVKPNTNETAKERIKGMVELRECVDNLIHYQLEDYSEETIKGGEQETLNRLYDSFTENMDLLTAVVIVLPFVMTTPIISYVP